MKVIDIRELLYAFLCSTDIHLNYKSMMLLLVYSVHSLRIRTLNDVVVTRPLLELVSCRNYGIYLLCFV